MKIHSLKIEGFRRVHDAAVIFGDTTYLIGENNVGKSSVLKALELVLQPAKSVSEFDFTQFPECREEQEVCNQIVLTVEFRNVSNDAHNWVGFKGRVLTYELPEGSQETGNKIVYRKTFDLKTKKALPEILSFPRSLKEQFAEAKNADEFIAAGATDNFFNEIENKTKPLNATQKKGFELINELWDVDETQKEWVKNPGGIPQIVASKFPRFLLIPAEDKAEELGKSGILIATLRELFNEVRESSENYRFAQNYLTALAKEMDPSDIESPFGKLVEDLNHVLEGVFPGAKFHALADLNDPEKSIVPQFDIMMSSNVQTPIDQQGTGLVRSAVFAVLRFVKEYLESKDATGRGLIIAFEEPELYLHPNAANNMRDVIYELSTGSSQLICTTHSPYMIDLTRKPRQVLNNISIEPTAKISISPFNVTDAFNKLSDDDRLYVKMLMRMDEYAARAFFTEKVIIVEGDTEDVVFRESLKRLPDEIKKNVQSKVAIIKARGKWTIVSLLNYYKTMGIKSFVIHDKDTGKEQAERANPKILEALDGIEKHRCMLEDCVEDILGYPAPSAEKPYKAYLQTSQWGDSWEDVPEAWRNVVETAIEEYM